MRSTRMIQRAAGAVSQAEASKLVTEAAKRASTKPKKKHWLRKNSDLIILGITTVVAATAVNRKRQHQEYTDMTEAKLLRLEMERDTAMKNLRKVQQCLTAEAEEGLRVALSTRDGRVDRLKGWIDGCFDRSTAKPQDGKEDGKEDRKPSII